jgi:hypothetical protein
LSGRLENRAGWALLAVMGLVVAVNIPILGSAPWPFHPPAVHPHGILGRLVRAAGRHWDFGTIRLPVVLAGVAVALASLVAIRLRPERARAMLVLAALVCVLVLVPPVLLQAGLRQATAPWYFVNDSTYQIELGGDLIRHGHNPYGHDYTGSGLSRFYPAVGLHAAGEKVALRHFAYFPGTPLTAAVWRVLPAPLDDYRFFVLLATLACFGAVLLFRAPAAWRLGAAVLIVANPIAARAPWFGTADAPSLFCLVLAFALVTRSRMIWAAVSLALAVLLKQFALIAVPFVALMIAARAPRAVVRRAALVFVAIVAIGILPFLVADPGAFWGDTISYGARTYRIIGYGLSDIFLHLNLVDNRYGSYPFLPIALVTWLPATLWLLWNQRRSGMLWLGAAGFAVSMFLLLFISRVFQTAYLIWPFTGLVVAVLIAAGERETRLGVAEPPGLETA